MCGILSPFIVMLIWLIAKALPEDTLLYKAIAGISWYFFVPYLYLVDKLLVIPETEKGILWLPFLYAGGVVYLVIVAFIAGALLPRAPNILSDLARMIRRN